MKVCVCLFEAARKRSSPVRADLNGEVPLLLHFKERQTGHTHKMKKRTGEANMSQVSSTRGQPGQRICVFQTQITSLQVKSALPGTWDRTLASWRPILWKFLPTSHSHSQHKLMRLRTEAVAWVIQGTGKLTPVSMPIYYIRVEGDFFGLPSWFPCCILQHND